MSVAPIFLMIMASAALAVGLLCAGRMFGPSRDSSVKQMPYESGMDPVHDTRRRFDVRFHLVAIAFLIFDVELLFLYPWAVASRPTLSGDGTDQAERGINAVIPELVADRELVFAGVAIFFLLLVIGFIYDWRKGVFRWR